MYRTADEEMFLRIWGGDGNRDDADPADTSDDNESDEDENESDDEDADDDDYDSGSDSDKPKAKTKKTNDDADADSDALKRENIRLKQRLDKIDEEKREKTKDSKDRDKELTRIQDENARLTTFMNTSFVETAILKEKKYDWHDISDVMRFVDKNSIRIDLETGEIDGLGLELKRLAKDKPYLLAKKEKPRDRDDEDDKEDKDKGPGGRRPSGTHPFGTRNRREAPNVDALRTKYKIGLPSRAV